jgi:thiol-disulfide isomerase/thioredoxin
MVEARNFDEIRTPEDALKLEGVLSKQEGDTYVLMFADWCGHCQTYKPFWQKLAKLANKMANMAAVQDTQQENVPTLKEAALNGYPTVLKISKGKVTETLSSTAMRDEGEMRKRVLGSDGGPVGTILQTGGSFVQRAIRKVHSFLRTKKHGRRPSRRNPRTRRAKRHGRAL